MKINVSELKSVRVGAGFGNRSDFRFDAEGQTGWQPAEVLWLEERESKGGNPMLVLDCGHPPVEGQHVGKRTRMYLLTQKALWKLKSFLAAACPDLLEGSGEVDFNPQDLVGRKFDALLEWDEGSADYEPKLQITKMETLGSQVAAAPVADSTNENKEDWF